jgi:hypothetical protein
MFDDREVPEPDEAEGWRGEAPDSFSDLLCGTFYLSEKDIALHQLAEQYHNECDEYDKSVCSGERDGVPMPLSRYEFVAINKHALKVRERIIAAAEMNGASKREIVLAIQQWHRAT